MSAKPRVKAVQKIAKAANRMTAATNEAELIGSEENSNAVEKQTQTTAEDKFTDDESSGMSENSPLKDPNGSEDLQRNIDLPVMHLLYGAGLGGPLNRDTSSPATQDPRLVAARLFAARSPNAKRSPSHTDGERTSEVAGSMTEDRTALVPYRAEWQDVLARLLEDPVFDPRAQLDSALKGDLVWILAHMPFEFRRRTASLLRKGYRVFAKVPCKPAEKNSHANIVSRGCIGAVRPISCPEPAGEGCVFALAWAEGGFWEYEKDDLAEIDELIGTGLFSECSRLRNYIAKARKRMVDRQAQHVPGGLGDESLSALATLLDDMTCMDDAEFLRLAQAFRAGATYSQRVLYAGSESLYNEWASDALDGWQSIIAHALLRHGLDINRTTLLEKLGCLNTHEFKKDSTSPLKFDNPYTPPASGVSFDKAFKQARKQVKQYVNIRSGQSGNDDIPRFDTMVINKRKTNARHQDRAAKNKETHKELSAHKKANLDAVAGAAKSAMDNIKKKQTAKATQELNRKVLAATARQNAG